MKTTIIAEIGINHNGDLAIAKKLIDLAHVAGCDSVKFQKRNPDVCVPEDQKSKLRDTPWGRMTYIEYKHRMEFGKKEFDEINEYCKGKIKWSVSVWDKDSVDFMERYLGSESLAEYIKIPSALITDLELVEYSKKLGLKVIASTGMSTMEEVDALYECLKGSDFALLHCNSSYPASIEELNLKCIQTMKERYDCEVGYSGHEFRLGTSVAAIYLGATIVERHITLDRTAWGTDQMASVEPQGLIKLVNGIRELEKAYGHGVKTVTNAEVPIRLKLRVK
jgi:N-acetylneuraminate synthase